MWFLVCDEEYVAFGNSPKEAYESFMETCGDYHYRNYRYFKGEEKKVKVELVVEED
jgi:hypothetical protein